MGRPHDLGVALVTSATAGTLTAASSPPTDDALDADAVGLVLVGMRRRMWGAVVAAFTLAAPVGFAALYADAPVALVFAWAAASVGLLGVDRRKAFFEEARSLGLRADVIKRLWRAVQRTEGPASARGLALPLKQRTKHLAASVFAELATLRELERGRAR